MVASSVLTLRFAVTWTVGQQYRLFWWVFSSDCKMPQEHPRQRLIRQRRMKCSTSNVSALSFDLRRLQPSRRSCGPQP